MVGRHEEGEMEEGVVIREGRVEDAAEMIAMMQELCEEPGIGIPLGPGEFQNTVEEEKEWIRWRLDTENCLLLVAVATQDDGEEEIVGMLDCTGGKRRAALHETVLGIVVKKVWRDRGVGTALMERALAWARESGVVKRVQLEVFTNNERAIHVYEKVGFVTEGVRRRALWKDREWVDSVVMGALL